MSLSQALQSASLTDPGRVRDHNEDCIESRPDMGLFVLADGRIIVVFPDGATTSSLARLTADGHLDASFNPASTTPGWPRSSSSPIRWVGSRFRGL